MLSQDAMSFDNVSAVIQAWMNEFAIWQTIFPGIKLEILHC